MYARIFLLGYATSALSAQFLACGSPRGADGSLDKSWMVCFWPKSRTKVQTISRILCNAINRILVLCFISSSRLIIQENLAFDPEGGITSENGDRVAFLLDSACNRVINWGTYDALGVGKGFEAKMGMSYDGTGPELGWQVTIESRVISMGAGMGIADATIKINGEEKEKSCTGEKTKPEGLGVDHWKACNFKPGDVWPKPWWPNFSGFN
ncbi:unnamed protein product [Colletotrichum noveboracense]|uniref:Uncharacterized protein n=1 Tax=Colletotrichum noveboracense TaxID=2664923 RepID=A0A9W4S155_9PEZI|nr:unnamed protein product [Colletotrichum noveboracense]